MYLYGCDKLERLPDTSVLKHLHIYYKSDHLK
jgi:hypothetical protein